MGLGWEEMSRVEFLDAIVVGGGPSDGEIEPVSEAELARGKGGEKVEEKMV